MLTRRRFLAGTAAFTGAALLGCRESLLPTPSPTASLLPTPSPTPAPPTSLPLRQRIAQLLIVGFRGRQPGTNDPILADIRDLGLGGVILFGRNMASPAQLATLTATLRNAAGGRPLLIATDQEGGSVARLAPVNGFAALPSAAELGRTGDAGLAREVGGRIGAMLGSVGINLNLAPVVDLNVNPENPSIGALGRSFSADPAVVISLAEAQIEGEHRAAVPPLTTIKHFPGLGSATGDTDVEVVDVSRTWTERELEPFRGIIADDLADLVMVGNALNGQIDPQLPGSLSPATIDLLRSDLGHDGVVITDDLQAGALRAGYADADILRLALLAGCDLLLLASPGSAGTDTAAQAVDTIARQVEAGDLDEALIDRAAARIARLAARGG